MKLLVRALALLCLSTLVFAATPKTFSWTPPTEYEDETPLPQGEIESYNIYCDGAEVPIWNQPNEPLGTDTWTAPNDQFALGIHVCTATAVATNGEESVRSNAVNFTVVAPRPKAPALAVQ